jgi:hypothetical protein
MCLKQPTVRLGGGVFIPLLLLPQRLLELVKNNTIVESHQDYKISSLTHPKSLIFGELKEEALIYISIEAISFPLLFACGICV